MWCVSKHDTLRCANRIIKLSPRSCRARQFCVTHPCRAARQRVGSDVTALSTLWIPTGGITSADGKDDDGTSLLIRGGFVRQAQSGIFHLLPIGKALEDHLVTKLRRDLTVSLDASEVSLSSLSSEKLWQRSGRIEKNGLAETDHQFLTVNDRKESHLILSPTHEEEITNLVASCTKSYKDFPLRLFQINRKYRDELRPRGGLLRTKEFVMKDLYTFDTSEDAALKTYEAVRRTYRTYFRSLGLAVIEAKASSGDMGGSHSHEFHLLSESGEDTLHICQSCGFAENEEVSTKPKDTPLRDHICPQCDDKRMASHNAIEIGHTFHLGTRYTEPLGAHIHMPVQVRSDEITTAKKESPSSQSERVPLQMGCHGIGISRLLGAVASLNADEKGLRWPLQFFHTSAVIIFEGPQDEVPGLVSMIRALKGISTSSDPDTRCRFNFWLDDRERSLPWKLKDAELIGYPIAIVLGRRWRETGEYEIKCRFDSSLSTRSKDLLLPVLNILNTLDSGTANTKWDAISDARTWEKHAAKLHPVNAKDLKSLPNDPSSKLKLPGGAEHQRLQLNGVQKAVPAVGRNSRSLRKQSSSPQAQNTSWMPQQNGGTKTAKTSNRSPSTTKSIGEITKANAQESHDMGSAEELGDLSREDLLEKVQLLERLFALQDKEKKAGERRNSSPESSG